MNETREPSTKNGLCPYVLGVSAAYEYVDIYKFICAH